MFITGPLLITAPLLLKRQPCINNHIIIIIIIIITSNQLWSLEIINEPARRKNSHERSQGRFLSSSGGNTPSASLLVNCSEEAYYL